MKISLLKQILIKYPTVTDINYTGKQQLKIITLNGIHYMPVNYIDVKNFISKFLFYKDKYVLSKNSIFNGVRKIENIIYRISLISNNSHCIFSIRVNNLSNPIRMDKIISRRIVSNPLIKQQIKYIMDDKNYSIPEKIDYSIELVHKYRQRYETRYIFQGINNKPIQKKKPFKSYIFKND